MRGGRSFTLLKKGTVHISFPLFFG
uniref:Uncharacterized protein n=1 Tax=Anguilla anguilla TaxID=7936 RepID=A0A0E9PLQ6_ANGAN